MQTSNMLAGKVALVTGAGGGIGREIAVAMATAGADILINDIGVSLTGEGGSGSPAEQTKQIIEQRGGRAAISTESVSEWASAKRSVEAALDAFGRIDIVVNNAGILRDVIFHKMSPEDWLAVINVHLNGSFFISRAAAEHFRKQESGSYVHMTSTSGLVGNFGQANYSAAKLGITALSKSIALDMARYNVRSNCIAPFAWSRMTSSIPADTPEQKAQAAADDAGQERAAGGLSRLRCGVACVGAGLRRPHERDFPDEPEPADPFRPPVRGLDAGPDRRARHAGAEGLAAAARPQPRRVFLGPGLSRASQPPTRNRKQRGRHQLRRKLRCVSPAVPI